MGLLDSFNGLSPIGKVAVVGAAGGAVLMFMNRGGAAAGGTMPDGTIILPENYEALGLMQGTEGAEWGGGGYEYFAEVNQQNMDLLRRIWDTSRPAQPPATGQPTTPPGTNPTPHPLDPVRQRISNINQRFRLNRHSAALMQRGGLTEEEQRRMGLMSTRNDRIKDRLAALRATQVPVQTTTTTPPAGS